MDSDEEYSDFESQESYEIDDNEPKAMQPSFETLTANDIVELMNQFIENVNAVIQMPATTTRILLSHTNWERQDLLGKLTDENRDEFFKKAHVLDPFAEEENKANKSNETTECNICYTELSQEEIVGLGCGHTSCKDCWRQYLTYQIVDDGKADSIKCTDTKCGIVVDDQTIMQLLSDENIKQKYQHLISNSFVERFNSLRWCPSPGCVYAIKATNLLSYQVNCTCKCGHSFCFNCGDNFHGSVPCSLMENWKANSNDLNVEYFTKYTKECPKCNAVIEKNGGCNRMICRKCQHPFCWLCHGPMETYEHQCNQYKDADGDRANKQRWQHYFQRYSMHSKSLKCEESLKEERIKEIMDDLQAAGKTWNEVQFLDKAVDILCESRKQLMFTYIFAYYVEEQNQKTIFEANQNDLESATEALSQYMEQNITEDNVEDMMHKVMDKSRYCERRQQTMQTHIQEGFENDWWTFTTGSWSRLKKMK